MRQGATASTEKPTTPIRRSVGWKIGATTVVSVALLALALHQVDLGLLERSLLHANYLEVGGAVAMYFVDLGFRSARWRILLSSVRAIPSRRLYPVLVIGYMANNLLPARIGELSRAYLVGRREDVSPGAVLASVAIERVIDGLTVLVLLVLALPALPMAAWLGGLIQLAGAIFGAAIVGSFVLALARPSWVAFAAGLLRRLPDPAGDLAARLLDWFVVGFAILRDSRKLSEALLLSVVIWIVGAATYLLVAGAFGVGLSPVGAMAAICVVNLATAVPLAPGGLGAFEVAAVAIFSLLGVTGTVAAGITIVLHAVLFLPVVVAGLVFLWRLNLSLDSLWTGARQPRVAPVLEQVS